MAGRQNRKVLVVDDLDFFHHRGAVPQQVAVLNALVATGSGTAVGLAVHSRNPAAWAVQIDQGEVAALNGVLQGQADGVLIKGDVPATRLTTHFPLSRVIGRSCHPLPFGALR